MPRDDEDQRFKRNITTSSELDYVRKMKYFYEDQLNHLSRMIGEEPEFGVLITDRSLIKIEERLSDFEKKEKEIVDNYRKFARKVEGVAI